MEWQSSKRWNPFNSAKLLAHVPHWRRIKPGESIPPPILVTIDPTNVCNLNCLWCNSRIARQKNAQSIPRAAIADIAQTLRDWGVKAVCIAGGGEPTWYASFGALIDALRRHAIQIGVVTNGTALAVNRDYLRHAEWVGISVDAAAASTYAQCKGVPPSTFDVVVEDIPYVLEAAEDYELGQPGRGNGVFFKFLIHRLNKSDIACAAELAKKLGCKGIHYRPAGPAWFHQHWQGLSPPEVAQVHGQLMEAMRYDDDNFSVYGVTHKFDENLNKCNSFQRCHAVFMTCVIMPPSDRGQGINVGLCCDRRGDGRLLLAENVAPAELPRLWGSEKHYELWAQIDVASCPRCTYQPHNQIFEQVICQDNMTIDFI